MRCFTFLLALGLSMPAAAQTRDTTAAPVLTFGAFADLYYAYDFGKPVNFDRSYTTQPARHNEFNVNLAFVEARLAHEKFRGRVALQAGTSVQSNYLAEPSNGLISGGDLSRHIQEAMVGVRLGEGLWIDGGIFFSHIGQEGWISRDNPTYTRSLIADYTPYYSSGVKLTWTPSSKLTAQLHALNGWQNISETNGDKAVGLRFDWALSPALTLGYSNFLGNEVPDDEPARTRFFNQVFGKATVGSADFWLTLDYGTQDTATEDGATWYGGSFIGRLRLSSTVALSGRVERYSDPNQIIVATGEDYGFASWSESLGLDVNILQKALWRTEVRLFQGDDPLWPDGAGPLQKSGGFVVTSLALSF